MMQYNAKFAHFTNNNMLLNTIYFVSSPAGQFIIYSITFVFLLALILLIRGFIRYGMGLIDLDQAQANVRQLPALPPAITAANIHTAILNNCQHPLLLKTLNALLNIANSQRDTDPNALLDSIHAHDQTLFTNQYLRFARSTMIMLGLFGTFYGLTTLAGNMSVVLNTVNTNSLPDLLNSYTAATEQLRTVVNPMQTAFITSFWGLFGALLLSVLLLIYNYRRQQFLTQFDTAFLTLFYPLFQPLRDTERLDRLTQATLQNTQLLNGVAIRLENTSLQLGHDFEGLTQFMQDFKTSMSGYLTAHEALLQNVQAVQQLLSGYKTQADATATNQTQLLQALAQQNTSLETVQQRLQESNLHVGDWLQQIITSANNQQQAFTQGVKDQLEVSRNYLNSGGTAITRFGSYVDRLETILEHLNDTLSSSSSQQLQKLNDILTVVNQFAAQKSSLSSTQRNNQNTADQAGYNPSQQGNSHTIINSEVEAIIAQEVERQVKEIKEKERQKYTSLYGNTLFAEEDRKKHLEEPGIFKTIFGDAIKKFKKRFLNPNK
ncbi:MAG: MotA/TolQ/ExbB proton channel family protein [Sphingobacteriales bacterium]|nr:MotA/TolQ/ExbB proton channel family protein [Sphingobacteriales bacterium]MBP9140110.1 MotA/TolQ/ExbB proton channel family protein [Chitinophagales bacterium]MBK6889971.1 MotA/TolQ/ExbB proton channel family protein [Sphingobacteriales bacterium]MBK7527505.1 MotA/TolQ/ExbB proton channel family protein [Sphingobacteriales bacterium]MBK8678147.1 MotA/TolQ/ExbB proton channel family protein [Sphingobacteriales bacterium]